MSHLDELKIWNIKWKQWKNWAINKSHILGRLFCDQRYNIYCFSHSFLNTEIDQSAQHSTRRHTHAHRFESFLKGFHLCVLVIQYFIAKSLLFNASNIVTKRTNLYKKNALNCSFPFSHSIWYCAHTHISYSMLTVFAQIKLNCLSILKDIWVFFGSSSFQKFQRAHSACSAQHTNKIEME